jgi:hypothetical protein
MSAPSRKTRRVKKGLVDASRSSVVHGAALHFAKAWAKQAEQSGGPISDEVNEAAEGLLRALGVQMKWTPMGKRRLVRVEL